MMMMGFAYQRGLLPLSAKSDRAGDRGQRRRREDEYPAFQLGRLAAADPARLASMMKGQDETVAVKTLDEMSLDEIIAHRVVS